jgi:seryl-tRNA synthetase
MLELKFIRENSEIVREGLKKRDPSISIESLLELDNQWRNALRSAEDLKAERNKASEEISKLKKEKQNADEKIKAMRAVGDQIKELDEKIKGLDEQIQAILLTLPNLPHPSVPVGLKEEDNIEIHKWGTPKKYDFEPLAHWDLGELHDVLDFGRAAKITGARFPLYKGWGAKLERVLINFMLDLHTQEDGYTEIFPPILANREALIGTTQLPKFAEEMFRCADDPYYLISTSEISLVNIHREEILQNSRLPIYYTAFTPCFRREAGAAGKDTRGLIRNHQFNKVEMVKFTRPEDSYQELEKLTKDAEKVLQKLNLPYRVVEHCAGDLGFSAAKGYDIEVWFPSQNTYREISSCSNVEDFQARRANIRYRKSQNEKPEYVHTLNGSGLAVGRTWAAILENYQNADRSINIPEILQPYFNGKKLLELNPKA